MLPTDREAADELLGLARIFIAWKLADAKRAEEVLTALGVDYTVRVEPVGRTMMWFTRHGAVFYVPVDRAETSAAHLTSSGLGRGVIPADADDREP